MKFEIITKDNAIVNIDELINNIDCQSTIFLNNILAFLSFSSLKNKDILINKINEYLKKDHNEISLKQFIYQNNFKGIDLYSFDDEEILYLVYYDNELTHILKIEDELSAQKNINEHYNDIANLASFDLYDYFKNNIGSEVIFTPLKEETGSFNELKNKYNLQGNILYNDEEKMFLIDSIIFKMKKDEVVFLNSPVVVNKKDDVKKISNFITQYGFLNKNKFNKIKQLVTMTYEENKPLDKAGWAFVYSGVEKMIKDLIKCKQNPDLYVDKTGITFEELNEFLIYFMSPLIFKYNEDENTLSEIDQRIVLEYLQTKDYITKTKPYVYTKKEHGVSLIVIILEMILIAFLVLIFLSIDI